MITLPFSVGVFMVRSWAPNAGEDAVGRMAGLMVRPPAERGGAPLCEGGTVRQAQLLHAGPDVGAKAMWQR